MSKTPRKTHFKDRRQLKKHINTAAHGRWALLREQVVDSSSLEVQLLRYMNVLHACCRREEELNALSAFKNIRGPMLFSLRRTGPPPLSFNRCSDGETDEVKSCPLLEGGSP